MISEAVIWNLLGRFGQHGISLIVSIVLARLLVPEHFGLIAMGMVLVSISKPLLNVGLGAALIQQKDVTEEQYSTVFYINLIVGVLLACLIYGSAGFIADFYKQPNLVGICQALSSVFIISSFGIIQRLKAVKAMKFRLVSFIELVAIAISGGAGISFALAGYEVWALVWQQIILALARTILLWIAIRWRPLFLMSFSSISDLLSYSGKRLLDVVVSNAYERLDIIIIGKVFDSLTLGYYTRAKSLETIIASFTAESLRPVFLIASSDFQEDQERLRRLYKLSFSMVATISIGMSALFYLLAEDIVALLFGQNWNQSAEYFSIIALNGYVYPICSIGSSVLLGTGYAGRHLALGLWAKLVYLGPLYIAYSFGVIPFLWSNLVYGVIVVTLNMAYVRSVLQISLAEQWLYIFRILALSVSAFTITGLMISYFDLGAFWGAVFLQFNLIRRELYRT